MLKLPCNLLCASNDLSCVYCGWNILRMRNMQVEEVDGFDMVRRMAAEVQIMMQHKIDAIKRIMELAENIALDHKYDKVPPPTIYRYFMYFFSLALSRWPAFFVIHYMQRGTLCNKHPLNDFFSLQVQRSWTFNEQFH